MLANVPHLVPPEDVNDPSSDVRPPGAADFSRCHLVLVAVQRIDLALLYCVRSDPVPTVQRSKARSANQKQGSRPPQGTKSKQKNAPKVYACQGYHRKRQSGSEILAMMGRHAAGYGYADVRASRWKMGGERFRQAWTSFGARPLRINGRTVRVAIDSGDTIYFDAIRYISTRAYCA